VKINARFHESPKPASLQLVAKEVHFRHGRN
jgi:hypothetical protein